MPSQPPPNPPTRRERRELARAQTQRVRARARAARPPAWRSPFAVVSGAAVVAIVILIVVLNQKPAGSSDLPGGLIPAPANAAVATMADGEALGRAAAPVQLEIWADFQCPVCGTLVKDYLPRLSTDFVIPGQVRVVPHDIAILGAGSANESLGAAVAARCAGTQGKYWTYHDWLYWNQKGENKGAFSSERLAAIADAVGLDRTAWDACLKDPAQTAAIQRQTTDAASIGINSTPSFRFGGQITSGLPRAYGDLASAIRKLLPSAAPTATLAGTAAPTTAPTTAPAATASSSPAASQ